MQHLQFAQLLADQGFVVAVPHYFDATGTYWADDKTILREFPTWIDTISTALDEIGRHEKADISTIGLVGFSLGAYLAIALAVEQPRIKAVVDFFGGIPPHSAEKLRKMAPVLFCMAKRIRLSRGRGAKACGSASGEKVRIRD